jgi:PAT family beta-lactamase induction signal transducer AmpG
MGEKGLTDSAAILAPPAGLALSDHRSLRLFTLFVLYVAQGLPIGLFYFALPSWQAQNGATAAAVGGVLALTSLPWSLKLINGVIMDRFAFLAMGRRRPWIIAAQGSIAIGLLAMAVANPDPIDAALLGAFALAINIATSFQDVAVDGLAVDVLPMAEHGRANGFMFGGQAIGIAAGASLSGTLIAGYGLPVALLTLAGLVAAILMLVLVVRERPGERLLPWTPGAAAATNLDRQLGSFAAIVRTVYASMADRPTLLAALALFLAGATYGQMVGLLPLHGVRALGWTDDTYANWAGQANLAAGLLGVFVFGFLTEWLGARRTFMLAMGAMAIAGLAFLWLLPMAHGPTLLVAAIFLFIALDNLRTVSGSALAMRLCVPAVAATQFSLLMAVANLGISAASAGLGTLDRLGGIPAMLVALAVMGVASAGVALLARAGR